MFFVVFGMIVLFFIVNSIFSVFSKKQSLENDMAQLDHDVVSLENTNDELKRLIEYLQTPEYIESQARTKLGLRLPGEEVVVITDLSTPSLDKNGEYRNTDGEGGIWGNPGRWWRYFFGE